MEERKRTYTVVESAKILGITKNRAYQLVNSGVLKSIKCGKTLVSIYAIDEFLNNYAGFDLTNPHCITQLVQN